MKTLSPEYRIKPADIERGHKLFVKEFVDGQTLTEQEIYSQQLLLDAERMHAATGTYPTVQEVHNRWDREEEARKKR